jgi:hypothetical protein
LCAQWGKLPCGAEPRIELGPALQQADALPTEPRRTMTEPRRTILKNKVLLIHASFYISQLGIQFGIAGLWLMD